ncbi:3'(2'),5'-bisphosphate nucleotidase CysQ family protein [Leptospira noguchii]|uniref:Inositol monophosphatase family protein n=1 Tax=Leptospira noguchii serovar Autumnalis str. ZUN142 TaxID=1085540 RepID=M6UJM8_9LEPT|nr:inositol monophosphatase family protein [Leptospira noguchii]EMO42991.1 inositol monophosphatase family protein [Leptospira noguchii serovar Autumnalis str. ZUN142]EMS88667.1 inositol monophosphatase family protein [Leptospira noguchii str. Hook]UOG47553.1 inositol monophosphatase [Leptospira noguchii]
MNTLDIAVKKVGDSIEKYRRQRKFDGKWEGSQFKADVDLIAHNMLKEELTVIDNIPIVSEEDISSQNYTRPSDYWLIDPIDGTASFVHGFKGYVCQVARISDHKPVVASVYAPALAKLYSAEEGRGGTLNGKRIRVNPLNLDKLTIVDNYPEPQGISNHLYRRLNCKKYVESGSIGLKICLVADGTADLFVKDVKVRDWDVAPGHLILKEAGGLISQFNTQPFHYYTGTFEKNGLVATTSVELDKLIFSSMQSLEF